MNYRIQVICYFHCDSYHIPAIPVDKKFMTRYYFSRPPFIRKCDKVRELFGLAVATL